MLRRVFYFFYDELSYAHCPLVPSGLLTYNWTPTWYCATYLDTQRMSDKMRPRKTHLTPLLSIATFLIFFRALFLLVFEG